MRTGAHYYVHTYSKCTCCPHYWRDHTQVIDVGFCLECDCVGFVPYLPPDLYPPSDRHPIHYPETVDAPRRPVVGYDA